MERRIFAELFVEDEKAIEMDKEIISYAKGVIDYQCQECGISTGDMRILDDDNPEDAKASNIADKIFKSEENDATKVWVVEEENVEDVASEREIRKKPNDKVYEEARDWLRKNAEPDYDDGEICYEEVLAQMLFDGHSIPIIDNEDEDREVWLSLSNLAIGIQKAFREGYYSGYNWLVPDGDGFGEWHLETSQIDSEVADAIIQFALFGEVIYG